MGYKRAGLAFSGNGYAEPAAVKRWLTADVIRHGLLGPLEPLGYLGRATQISRNLGSPEPLGAIADLGARAATWGYEILSLFAGDRADPDFEIFLGLDTVGPRWLVGVADTGARVRDDVAGWVAAWTASLAAAGVLFATGRFAPHDRPYPRPMPPRAHDLWPPGALDQYVGRAWHRGAPDTSAVLDRLESAALPAGARRSVEGDVLRIAFDAELGDVTSVAAARAAHERWLTPLVDAPIEPGWNELGDRAVHPARPTVRDPLSLYDEQEHIGYKALVVFPADGSVDEAAWADAAALARAGALSDGTPVRSVRLIFPRREDALAMHARALASGFEMTTYPEGKVYWQVHPEPDATWAAEAPAR